MNSFSRRRFCALSGASTMAMLGRKGNPCFGAGLSQAGSRHYTNPIIPGDHPDAGAIRVGHEYYLTHTSDDFTHDSLRLQWQFFRGYDLQRVSISPGILTLAADGTSAFDTSVMACIVGDRSYTVEVDVETQGECEAGLILFYNPAHSLGLTLGADGLGVLRNGSHKRVGVAANRATLRLVNEQQVVSMYYRLPGRQWVHLREAFDVSQYNDNSFGEFLDLRPALFAAVANQARFRSFRHTPSAIVPDLQG